MTTYARYDPPRVGSATTPGRWRYLLLHARFAPDNVACDAVGQGLLRIAPVTPSGSMVETTGPPTFPGSPLVPMPCSTTPAGPTRQAISTRRRGPRVAPRRGLPRAICLTGLDHTASALAVYASPRRLPGHHARLASGCRPVLPAGLATRRVPTTGFRMLLIHGNHPPFRSSRGARCIPIRVGSLCMKGMRRDLSFRARRRLDPCATSESPPKMGCPGSPQGARVRLCHARESVGLKRRALVGGGWIQ